MASRDSTDDRNTQSGNTTGPTDPDFLEWFALALVETCVRNTQLEDLHAGMVPRSAVGDYSDVTVVTPFGDIPWTSLSRISDPEMKALMIEIVDKVFTVLKHPEGLPPLGGAAHWNRPKLDEAYMRALRRRHGDDLRRP